MESPLNDESLLAIRCPSCGQRFNVQPELRGRTVECGSCEQQFAISEEVIVTSRKFYPGEKGHASLQVFQRQPLPQSVSSGVRPVQYGAKPDPALIEPMSPQRLLAGFAGVGLMVLMALILMFGTRRGGILDGMTFDKREMMAVFSASLGVVLLTYANPKARIKALLVGLLMGGGLITLPFYFTQGSVLQGTRTAAVPAGERVEVATGDTVSLSDQALREQLGLAPLEQEKERLRNMSSRRNVLGLWLRNLPASNKFLIQDYIIRVSGADHGHSSIYPRDQGSYLMVLSGAGMGLEDLARLVTPFGQVEAIHPELDVVQVHVDNEKFIEGPEEKLMNPNDPAFYELNKRELDCIDLGRVEKAVKRLVAAEPRIYRADISRRMIALLNEEGVTFQADLCRALSTWSDQPGPAGDAARIAMERLHAEKKPISTDMVDLLTKERIFKAIPILHELWKDDPTKWESRYAAMGPAIEPTMLAAYPETEASLRYSATRILGQVGGKASIPVLEAAKRGANTELQIVLADSLMRIRGRL